MLIHGEPDGVTQDQHPSRQLGGLRRHPSTTTAHVFVRGLTLSNSDYVCPTPTRDQLRSSHQASCPRRRPDNAIRHRPNFLSKAKSRFNILLNILQSPYITIMFLRAVFSIFALQTIFEPLNSHVDAQTPPETTLSPAPLYMCYGLYALRYGWSAAAPWLRLFLLHVHGLCARCYGLWAS